MNSPIESLVLVTCTGDRPEAFALCEKYMARQTAKSSVIEWLVLDDGKEPTKCNYWQTYCRRPEWAGPGSLVNKLKFACQYLQDHCVEPSGVAVVFIEDDDWYASTYLETIRNWLQKDEVVGEGCALYYNVKHRWWWLHPNMHHASLCSTALHLSSLRFLQEACQRNETDPFVDIRFWEIVRRRAVRQRVWSPNDGIGGRRQCVGIKSMPGRVGYGTGHKDKQTAPLPKDPNLTKLIEEIGEEDAAVYAKFYIPPVNVTPPVPRQGAVHRPTPLN